MIISSNKRPTINDFKTLIFETNKHLNQEAKKNESYFVSRNAQKLEDDVVDALTIISKGSVFDNSIVKVSGHRFPDIVAGKYYGVEVKSSKDTNWSTLGGSVNESTRIGNVDRIFLTFGKLVSPIEFISRPYEDCLSEVVVTHYPRYKINMLLESGETIFDKMNTSYDDFRASQKPVQKVIDHYKSQLRDGESLWWIDSGSDEDNAPIIEASISVKLWRTLPLSKKKDLMILGYVLFPEILSNSPSKYDKYTLWLATHHSVISTSMRDTFTAGGQGAIITPYNTYQGVPQSLLKISKFSSDIALTVLTMPEFLLKEHWGVPFLKEDRILQWIELATDNYNLSNHDAQKILTEIFNKRIL